jgi:poly(A) polymerase
LASHGDLSLHDLAMERLRTLPEEQIRPKPLITGHDLIQLGYKPGPEFSEVLTQVEDAQLEGRVTDRSAALELAKQLFAEK